MLIHIETIKAIPSDFRLIRYFLVQYSKLTATS